MTNPFSMPSEGIKVFQPESGWQEPGEADPMANGQGSDARLALTPERQAAMRELADALAGIDPLPAAPRPAGHSLPSHIEKPELRHQSEALAEVGESLSSFFHALQPPSQAVGGQGSTQPVVQWRDVTDLSRMLEQQIEHRQAALDQLAGLERDIRDTRESLMAVLTALADQERRNFDAANLRAQLSAVAARVIAERFQQR